MVYIPQRELSRWSQQVKRESGFAMYTIDTSSLLSSVQSLWGLVWGALRLDPAAFSAMQENRNAGWLALSVLLLGGVSVALGQSVALLVNRVSRLRFFISLAVTGIIIAAGILVWVSVIWLSATLVFAVRISYVEVLRTVSLGYAPFLFGIFMLLPYLGSFIGHVLDAWSFLAVLVAINVTLGLRLWQALVCILVGWLLVQGLKYATGKPIAALVNRLISLAAGAPLSLRVQKLSKIMADDHTEPPRGAKS
jgi:hypothetical protein